MLQRAVLVRYRPRLYLCCPSLLVVADLLGHMTHEPDRPSVAAASLGYCR